MHAVAPSAACPRRSHRWCTTPHLSHPFIPTLCPSMKPSQQYSTSSRVNCFPSLPRSYSFYPCATRLRSRRSRRARSGLALSSKRPIELRLRFSAALLVPCRKRTNLLAFSNHWLEKPTTACHQSCPGRGRPLHVARLFIHMSFLHMKIETY